MDFPLADEAGEEIEPIQSPTFERGSLDWDTFDADLEAWMEEDTDTEAEDGSESDVSNQSTSSRRRKRKRAISSVDGSDAEENDGGTSGDVVSDLQQRKKRALERSTGLANVTTADQSSGLPSPDTTGPEEDVEEATKVNGDDKDASDEDDAFTKEFMEAMESETDNEAE